MKKTIRTPWLGAFAGLTLLTGAGLVMLEHPESSALPSPVTFQAGRVAPPDAPMPPLAGPIVVRQVQSSPPDTTPETLRLARDLAKSGNEEELFQLKTLLGDPESAEGMRIAQQLLRDKDSRVRTAGVDILTDHSLTDPDVHHEVVRLLTAEPDAGVLTRLLNNLDAPIDFYGKDAEMSHALHSLLSHADPDVRSQAVLQLLQWDDYPTLEGFLYQALNDPSQEVRLSAATVVSLIDTRSSTLKGALLSLRNNPQESRDMRESIDAAINRIDDYNRDYVR